MIRTGRKGERTRIRANRTAQPQSHTNIDSLSKVRQNWYVYFRDGAFTFARYDVFHAAASATKDLSRVFTPWSHVVALIYQQLTKTESLNGVCDTARLHASQWQELRGAVPPRRNTFSNANQHRDPTMMETLYWKMLDRASGAPAAARSQVPFEVETELQQTRGSRTSRRLGEAQHRPASRRQAGGNRTGPSRGPCICRVFCLSRCLQWDSISPNPRRFRNMVTTF